MLKYYFTFLSLICLPVSATNLNIKTLTTPLEIWSLDVPDPSIGSIKATFSLIGAKFYPEDIVKKRYRDSFDENSTLLTGFVISSTVGNDKIPKDCPYPRVNIVNIQGIKDKNGKIILWSIDKIPLYNGTIDFFKGVRSYEINCDKKNVCNILADAMYNIHSDRSINAQRIGPLKITKIQ